MIPKRRMMQNIRETGYLSSPSRKSRILSTANSFFSSNKNGGVLPLFFAFFCTPRYWILSLVTLAFLVSFQMWQRLAVTVIGTTGSTNSSFLPLNDNPDGILSTSPVSRSVFSSFILPSVSTSSSSNPDQLLYGASSSTYQTNRRSRLRSKLQEQGIYAPSVSMGSPKETLPLNSKKGSSSSAASPNHGANHGVSLPSSTEADKLTSPDESFTLDESFSKGTEDTEDWDNMIEKLKETQGRLPIEGTEDARTSSGTTDTVSSQQPMVPPVSPLVPKIPDAEVEAPLSAQTEPGTSSSSSTASSSSSTSTSSSIIDGFQWITDIVIGKSKDEPTNNNNPSLSPSSTSTVTNSLPSLSEEEPSIVDPESPPPPFNGLFLPRSSSHLPSASSSVSSATTIDIFNETSLLKLLSNRKWAEPDSQSIFRAANWVSDDRVLLVDAHDDPDAGIAFTAPDPSWIDPSLLDARRVQHELKAELSIMIPTAPRILAPWIDDTGATPSYWMARADCRGNYIYRNVEPLENSTTYAWIKHLASECEKDGKCLSFDTTGHLYHHYDQNFCTITPVVSSGIAKPFLGERDVMYFKEPPTIATLPRRFDLKEWPIMSTGEIRPVSRYDEAPTTAWWSVQRADIVARDIQRVDPSNNGKYLNEDEQKQYLRAVCLADDRCMGFSYPMGWLKYSMDIADIHASTRVVAELWSRVPIPPLDYIVLTVISLTRQIEEASGGQCKLGLTSPYDLLADEGITLPAKYNLSYDIGLLTGKEGRTSTNYSRAKDMYDIPPEFLARLPAIEKKVFQNSQVPPEYLTVRPFPDGMPKITDEDANGHYGVLGPRQHHPFIPSLRTHLYVMDTGSLDLHTTYLKERPGKIPRSAVDDYYWFRAFSWLRRKYGHSPCVTFVPATSYVRSTETNQPNHGRGMPDFHTDNRGKSMPRQQTKQLLDFTSALRFTAARSPQAHLLVWEDDCFACSATIDAYSRAVGILSLAEPRWGGLKVGNGGSGLLFNADLVSRLLVYLQTRRGSDNVDVSMWRFLHSGGWPDYISYRTRSAHRGLTSSFRLSQGSVWGRVKCGGELDFYWGFYGQCNGLAIRDRLAQAIKAQALLGPDADQYKLHPYLLDLLTNSSSYVALNFLFDWQCSAHSDLILTPLSPPKPIAPVPPMDLAPPHPFVAKELEALAAAAAAKAAEDMAAAIAASKAAQNAPSLP